MYNYVFPYMTKILQDEYMTIEIEKNMIELCKNNSYKKLFKQMLGFDNKHYEEIKEIIKDFEYKEDIQFPPIKPIDTAINGIQYLINLKNDAIQVYTYLSMIQMPPQKILNINKILKQEKRHLEILIEIQTSIKNRPYCTTSALDIIEGYKHMYEAFEVLKNSITNEDSEPKCDVIHEILKDTDESLDKLLKLIKSYIKHDLEIYKINEKDTLWKISNKYNCSIQEIMDLNSIEDPFDSNENKILLIPLHKNDNAEE